MKYIKGVLYLAEGPILIVLLVILECLILARG